MISTTVYGCTYTCVYIHNYIMWPDLQKSTMYTHKLKFILSHKLQQPTLCTATATTDQCNLVSFSEGYFANPVKQWLQEWCQCRAPIGLQRSETASISV